ncbi:MAG: Arylformamidase [Gammaproteobacteria bacterium]|jgi:arylformamidase|nr:Arylformamidase [Gammaproteobacteria bacterium]
MPIYDLTAPITPDAPVFPGDPSFQLEELHSVEHEERYSLCRLHMSNHMGTHIDFPAHVIRGGKTSTHYPLDMLIGPGVIIEWEAGAAGKVNQEFVQQQKTIIAHNRFVFFKAPSHSVSQTFIDKMAAEELVRQGVKIVGVDSLSIDSIDAEDLPAHHTLLSNDVLIVEGLNLKDVFPGEGEVTIAPLNIPDMDGLPVRVIMKR